MKTAKPFESESLRRVRRFAATGALVTSVHVGTAATLVSLVSFVPATANGVAFLIATGISYVINTMWCFSREMSTRQFKRFISVSLACGGFASAIAHTMGVWGYHYLVGILAVVLIVPPTTFMLHNIWTYR